MKLQRINDNPILKPNNNWWENRAVFNCGIVQHDRRVHMLYRAVGDDDAYISRLGYAVSEDGIHFKRFDEPVLEPEVRYEAFGIEDPHITLLDGKFYVTYTALSKQAYEKASGEVALALAEDFFNYERHGMIFPTLDDKDAVIFPEKIEEKYIMMHRPNWVGEKYGVAKPSMWLAYSDNLETWEGYTLIKMPNEEALESLKVGAGAPPIKTKRDGLKSTTEWVGIRCTERVYYC